MTEMNVLFPSNLFIAHYHRDTSGTFDALTQSFHTYHWVSLAYPSRRAYDPSSIDAALEGLSESRVLILDLNATGVMPLIDYSNRYSIPTIAYSASQAPLPGTPNPRDLCIPSYLEQKGGVVLIEEVEDLVLRVNDAVNMIDRRYRQLERHTFTTGRLAKALGVAPRTIAQWFDKGKLGGYKVPHSQDRRIPLMLPARPD